MFFKKIDEWLFTNIFEPAAWSWQFHTGTNSIRILRYMNGFVPFLAMYITYIVTSDEADDIRLAAAVFAGAMLALSSWSNEWDLKKIEYKLDARADGINTQRGNWQFRLLFSVLTCALFICIFMFTRVTFSACVVSVLYLLVMLYWRMCNAMPPGYEERKFVPHTV